MCLYRIGLVILIFSMILVCCYAPHSFDDDDDWSSTQGILHNETGIRYYLHTSQLSWQTAVEECERQGLILAVFHNKSQFQWLETEVNILTGGSR